MAIIHAPSFLSVHFRRHLWCALPQLLLVSLLTNVLGAANRPTFTYSTSGIGQINALATDSAGNTYITGRATASLVTTPGAFQSQSTAGTCFAGFFGYFGFGPCTTSFVLKLDPTGAVVFATYLGGSGSAEAFAIAVDQQGNVYVSGLTSGNDDPQTAFPTTPGAAFTSGSAFVTKLNPAGSRLIYSTFIPDVENLGGLAIDLAGNAYIAGHLPLGVSFPVTAGAFQTVSKAAYFPAFVAKLNAAGSALVYATYLCGSSGPSGADGIAGIAVDAQGSAYLTGVATSADFPVTPGAFLTTNPSQESVFVTKLNPQGSALVYSTYLYPGNGFSVKLDAQGTAFVLGGGFLTRVSADGSSLLYSTSIAISQYLGDGLGLDVDSAGNATIAGFTATPNLPVGVGAFQPAYAGGDNDVYIQRFTPAGQFAGGTYLGGSNGEAVLGMALGPNGSVVIGGYTLSPDFPGIGKLSLPTTPYVTSLFPSLTVMNAASYVATAIAPGEIVALLGYGIGPAAGVSAPGPSLPTQLAGVAVSFGGYPAPLFYVQSGQINAQVPWELAGQASTTVQVFYSGIASTGTPVVLAPSLPGIFYVNNSDGTRNSPSNPAHPGEVIAIYGTGGGSPLLPLSVTVGGETATALYSSSTRESGKFQIDVQLPSDLPPSPTASMLLTIGSASSPPVPITIGAH